MITGAKSLFRSQAFKLGGRILGVAAFALAGCTTIADTNGVSAAPATASLSDAGGYEGRVRLTRFLDEPDGYCLDVPGPEGSEMLQFPLVAHTCHADPKGDQVFSFNADGSGQIRWTTDTHDLCFTADEAVALSKLNLRACDQPELQSFIFTEKKEFQLSGTQLCVQVERTGPGPFETAEDGQDSYGRGRSVNAQFTHLMRVLELRDCGDGDPAMSRWQATE
ncbi:MAG: RICIN domain-containing protein [Pseudomonadota bacterium]